MMDSLHERTRAFQAHAQTQPGCTPDDNLRPINVRKHSAGKTLEAILRQVYPYTQHPERLQEHLDSGRITVDGKRPSLQQKMVAGNAIHVVVPDTVEPAVATGLVVLYEDPCLLVVDKPAPLPVHPCGRYNRNSLVAIARQAWPDLSLKPVHRLDTNTTGVLVFAKTATIAHGLMLAFQHQQIQKAYLARVHGVPDQASFSVCAPIARTPSSGGQRRTQLDGQSARTDVVVQQDLQDGTSLLQVHPRTGRTNQIRLHLQTAGFPIVGDAVYGHEEPDASAPLCLHALSLAFLHPITEKLVTFRASPPSHLTHVRSGGGMP